MLNKYSIHDAVYLEDTWVIKEGQQSGHKGIYTDYIQVEMMMMRIILGMVTLPNKCKIIVNFARVTSQPTIFNQLHCSRYMNCYIVIFNMLHSLLYTLRCTTLKLICNIYFSHEHRVSTSDLVS